MRKSKFFIKLTTRLGAVSLTGWIMLGLALGIIAGVWLEDAILTVAIPMAEIFLRLLRMTIMPLIITSILSGILAIGSTVGLVRLGFKTMTYFVISTLLAIFVGQFLVNYFRPGAGAQLGLDEQVASLPVADLGLLDIFYNLIPSNVFSALGEGDVLAAIFFCILFGVYVLKLDPPLQDSLTQFINGAYQVMMKMVHLIIRLAPIGVFAVMAKITATTGFEAFKSLGYYFLVVLGGLIIHFSVVLPLLLLLAGVNPLRHYAAVMPALITAFSTSSSMAALPLNIDCVINRCHVSPKITSFVLPIGATVNMNGTALYECVAAIFIAQVYGIELTWLQQGIVVLTSLLAAIGSAGIPMAGLVMMSIVLQSVGLPLEGIGMILAVDRILDMFRTTLNILGDSCGAVIIARWEGEKI